MKLVLTLVLSSLAAAAAAQELCWYSVEGRNYYEAGGCTPGSKASFYSSTHGGRLLGTETVAADGTALFSGPDSLRPQMVLNSGATGSHRVGFLKARELAFAAPALRTDKGQTSLSWDGAADAGAGVSFEVLRSLGGKPFQSVAVLPAKTGEVSLPYMYTEPASGEPAVYRIRVRTKGKAQRYLTAPMQLAGGGISVYPTAVTRSCWIRSTSSGGDYAVFGQDGRKLAAGTLTGTQTSVSLAELPAGNYVLRISSGGRQEQLKLVRL